ncbi:MAG TPA: tetratricopeptide repeat protein, partial [Pyrinomonadaceae bacterium]
MRNQNKLGALALAAALLFAPFSSVITASALARVRAQQEDVPSDAEQAMFTKGQNLYNQGHYDQAVTVLQDFLKTYPHSIITDLTLLWLGRSYMQLGKITDAQQVGQRLHEIKDTPFAEIYDGELETARRENPGSGGATKTAPANTATKTTEKPPAQTATRPPVAVPSPTPNRPALTINNKTPRKTGTTTAQAKPTPTPAVVASNTPQPRLITAAPLTITPKTTEASPPAENGSTRGGLARSRRTGRRLPATTATTNIAANANQSQPLTNPSIPATSASQPPRNANTIVPPRRNSATPMRTTPPAIANNRSTINNRPTNTNNSNAAAITTTTDTSSNSSDSMASRTSVTTTQPPAMTNTTTEPLSAQSGSSLTLTVKQVPNLMLSLRSPSETASPGQPVQLPLSVQNTGNKEDQFRLETDLPAEFQPSFSFAQGGAETGLPILVTPQLARGASVDVILNLRIPETATDGQQRAFFVRAASQSDYQVLKVSDGTINIVAAALGANSNASQSSVMPGDTFTQTITVRNQGSAAARGTRADFVFNPNFELVSASPSPITYDRPSRTAIWNLGDVGARDSRDINVVLRAMPNALAATSSLGRGAVRTQSLPLGSNFDSPSITVGKVPRARIDAVSIGLTSTPGDTIYIPFIVRNPGNSRDVFDLLVTAPNAPAGTIYADLNGDGQHQDSEPAVTQTSALDPQGGQFPMLLRV